MELHSVLEEGKCATHVYTNTSSWFIHSAGDYTK